METMKRTVIPLFLLLSASEAGQGEFLTGRVTVCEDFGIDLARILEDYNQSPLTHDTTRQLCVHIDAILRTLGRSKNKIAYTFAFTVLVNSICSLMRLNACWDMACLTGSLIAIIFAAAADYSAMDDLHLPDLYPTTYKDLMAHALRDRGLEFSHLLSVPVPLPTADGFAGILSAEDKLEEFVIQNLIVGSSGNATVSAVQQDIHVTWYRNNQVVFRLLPPGQTTRMTSGEALALKFFDGAGYLVSYGTGYLSELGTDDEDELAAGIVRAWGAILGEDNGSFLGVSSIEKGVEYVSFYVDVIVEEGTVDVKGEMEGFLWVCCLCAVLPGSLKCHSRVFIRTGYLNYTLVVYRQYHHINNFLDFLETDCQTASTLHNLDPSPSASQY
ncbi:uncharacterized protein BP01DRAFT_76727 [Aspergillus saccharolyticus JOP 1030-1]|uniref:Ig-like domain-containing protein n=1 Tax=Aspergillus saccharolyticus JOP 1030-1 TaxID=1450539 RepID=A0A319AT54_9EURO|nr:hypothetical protein BP01DRAFT_76727 [Aspergillus saccharolyticus JOP 1030-1]PYH49412.1 hypothetical protein BP01DRAFT_76727 [Aspergillus saccharolyticus JOP 1030-1]